MNPTPRGQDTDILYSLQIFINTAESLGFSYHPRGTVVTVEGPRFSSKAESKLFRSWGCDVINMTTVPEVCLAKEAGLIYSTMCLVTDYDCWKDDGNTVSSILSWGGGGGGN